MVCVSIYVNEYFGIGDITQLVEWRNVRQVHDKYSYKQTKIKFKYSNLALFVRLRRHSMFSINVLFMFKLCSLEVEETFQLLRARVFVCVCVCVCVCMRASVRACERAYLYGH